MVSLDLGCGKNKHPGAIGLDMNPGLCDVDVVSEVDGRKSESPYLPFRDNSFDTIYMTDFIEHIQDIPWLLSEVHRVAEPEAIVEIRYPHYSSRYSYSDVTHVKKLGLRAFEHFDPSTDHGEMYQYYTYFGRRFPYKIEKTSVEFHDLRIHLNVSTVSRISRAIYNLVRRDNYETFFAHLLPIGNVTLEMRVIK
ncbi:MAG: methyltransferase domain-containing protein [Candidatus Aenigmarchaeota archaeon]|nr:methyltransferase domain-containing protein [Candidatus Aenigmarchaeota archaeon]